MLGIVIGVSTFETMLAGAQGVRAAVDADVEALGANLILVQPSWVNRFGVRQRAGALTDADATALADLPSLSATAPVISTRAEVSLGHNKLDAQLFGTTGDFFPIRNWIVARGTTFSLQDIDGATRVCLVGQGVLEQATISDENALGSSVMIGGLPYQVIGVLAAKGVSLLGMDEDDAVVIPYTTLRRHVPGGDPHGVDLILASAKSSSRMNAAKAEIDRALRRRRHAQGIDRGSFRIADVTQVAEAAGSAFALLGNLTWTLAALSLLVGGIGIMNIMLVSVTERTREIGVRIALGAKQRDILMQFLVEAVQLSSLGGLLGLFLGAYATHALSQHMGWPRLLQPSQLAFGFGFAALVGVVFGLYPAIRAARLDPIEALRFE